MHQTQRAGLLYKEYPVNSHCSAGLILKFYLKNSNNLFVLQIIVCCLYRVNRARMLGEPSNNNTCLSDNTAYLIVYNDGQLSLINPCSKWSLGILADLLSHRGHHDTLRVWAPLRCTGGMIGVFGWRVKTIRYLANVHGFRRNAAEKTRTKLRPTTSPTRDYSLPVHFIKFKFI